MRLHLSPIAVAKATFAAEREMPADGVTKLTLAHIDDGDCTGKEYCDYDVLDGRWECKAPDMTCAIG